MPRAALALAVALPLAAADLIWKHLATTPSWAYHPRGPSWVLLSVTLIAVGLVLATVSTLRAVAVAAGVMAGGVLGNVLSATWNGLAVPDPIIVFWQNAVIAFNLADVFITTGILALTGALAVALLQKRQLLQSRREVATALQRAEHARDD